MDQNEAYIWLRERLIGPVSGGTARTVATALSGDLARLVNRQGPVDPWGWNERIKDYHFETGYPDALFLAADGRLVGTWIMGNDYRVKSQFYGGYPATYLERVRALFRDKKRVLHLFSGHIDIEKFPGDTVDISLSCALKHPPGGMHYTDDAQTLTRVPVEQYDLVMADPPYSTEDADHYQTSMVKRNVVMKTLARLPAGAHVVWLDQVLPMWRKDVFDLAGVVGIVKSTNHRFRVMTVFRRK